VGKKADARLEELGGKRIHALGLGDDSECIEDDFDSWSKSLIETLAKLDSQDVNMVVDNASIGEKRKGNPDFVVASVPNVNEEVSTTDTNSYSGSSCLSELARETKSLAKSSIAVVHNFPKLLLNDCYPAGRKPKKQLFDCPNFYAEGTAPFSVLTNRALFCEKLSSHRVACQRDCIELETYCGSTRKITQFRLLPTQEL
jgi:sulfite reductase alpha subunit-like flavoprotein